MENRDPNADLYEVRDGMLQPSDDPIKDLYFRARLLANRGARLENCLANRVPMAVTFHDVRLCLEAALKAKEAFIKIAEEQSLVCDWESGECEYLLTDDEQIAEAQHQEWPDGKPAYNPEEGTP